MKKGGGKAWQARLREEINGMHIYNYKEDAKGMKLQKESSATLHLQENLT